MIKAAIEKILSIANDVIEVDGATYTKERYHEVRPVEDSPSLVDVNSLASIVTLVKKDADVWYADDVKIYVHVEDYNRVEVFTSWKERMVRDRLYRAIADVPGFDEGWKARENALISLRTLFVPTDDINYLLDLLSRMDSKESVSSSDNGVTQTVQAQKGIALKETIPVKPRVKLTPFRTFLEVAQPEGEFILRVRETGGPSDIQIGLFGADGGVWKLVAKARIAAYLSKELEELIVADRVVVLQ